MRGGRRLIMVGGILFLGALAAGLLWWRFRPQPTTPGLEVTPEPEVVGMVEIVVAAQNIPRGMPIAEDAVRLQHWPDDAVPEGAIPVLENVYGLISRVDIVREMPLLEDMLTETPGDVGATGSDAALQIPEGKVAYALPVARYSSVAWALRPGDHVDVLLSFLMVDLDEEFQTIMPNNMSCISPPEGEGCVGGPMGRLEVLQTGWLVNVAASEGQRPRLVTQLTVQDAEVLHVGEWPAEEPPPAEEPEQPEEGQPPPSPRAAVEPLILIVTPQDAIVLDYALAAGARVNLLLRPAGETGPVTTSPVTLQYIMNRFNIELPSKLPYGTTPPLSQLERIPRSETAGQYGGGGE